MTSDIPTKRTRKNPFRRLSTLRHGRGFGVHSPLAFELIASVLRDKPAYYGDKEINRAFPNRRQRRVGRILLRLIARFHPQTANVPEMYENVVKTAGSRIALVNASAHADMTVVVNEDSSTTITFGRAAENSGPLILDNEKDLRIIIYRRGLSPTLINATL